jgi:hypothetical protein
MLACLLGGAAQAQEDVSPQSANIATMLRLAGEAKLAQSAEWHKINLYHAALTGVKSRVDDPSFFMAADGKYDPRAELESTIRGAYDDGMAENSRQPKLCRWVARYQYLSRSMQVLGFDYVPPHCESFERWKSGLAKDNVSLIFASIFLNSPASMYGHNFLRFDSAKPGEFNRLNDTTIGYTVNSQGDFGAVFLARSLAGGFQGNFVSVPYFMKVREYADLENRDLWEYQTDLVPSEIEKMQAFIWQHSFTYMDYYFFDDNCALMLLATLEAGRPSLNLIQDSKPWFIPLDSVKVIQQAGLVAKKRYRPSQYSTLIANVERAPVSVREQAVALAESMQADNVPVLATAPEQAQMLDLALGVVEYKRNQATSAEEAEPYNRFQLKLSNVRSRVEVENSYPPAPTPRESPDEGHGSFRAGVIAGRVGNMNYAQINLRSSYHDSLDPQAGFFPGSSSKIGDLYLRLNDKQIRFERLDLFDVFMPSVRTAWYRPPTIKANISIRRDVQKNDALSPAALRIELGAGEGFRVSEHAQVYLLGDSVMRLSKNSSLAVGPVAGWLWQSQSTWRAEANMGAFWRAAGELKNSALYRVSGGMAWDVANNQNNIRLTTARQWIGSGGDAADEYADIQLAYSHYF